MSHIFKKFRQDIIAVALLSSGLFLGLALLSYNPHDPSFNSIGQGYKAANYCGLVGSFLADLLYQFFGLSVWILVLSQLRLAYLNFKGEETNIRNIRFVWAILLILNFSSLLSLYLPEKKIFSEQIFLGGLLGLGVSQAIIRAFNHIGAQIILWSLTMVLVVFFSEKTLQELAKLPGELTQAAGKIKLWAKIRGFFNRQSILPKTESTSAARVEATKREDLFKIETENLRQAKLPLFSGEDEDDQDGEVDEDAIEPARETIFKSQPRRKVVLKVKPPKRVENWEMPKLSLLEDPPASRFKVDKDEIRRKADLLTEKLAKFKIEGQITDAKPGPLVTMYEFKPNADVKISEISNLEDDLSLALSSDSVRVMGQIPGTNVVGIETANANRETVFYKDLIAEEKFWRNETALPVALGKQANGLTKIENLRSMPHLLIAGTTGSGKSVFVRSIITGLLFRHSPKTLRMILIDPKMVDLADFAKVPHMVLPHITEPKKAVTALRWSVREMEKRYKSLAKFGASKIEIFNEKISALSKEEIAEHEKVNSELESQPGGRADQYYYTQLPYIVIVVDELADLMVVEKQNIEQPIQRLTQKARACGIHLILATQSPRKDVVTGLIKANIPGRVALKVANKMDSRIILDDSGAERLLPNGDMLFLAPGVAKPARHHGPYLSDKEITGVVKFWSEQSEPEYDVQGVAALEGPANSEDGVDGGSGGGVGGFDEDNHDEMYDTILAWAAEQKQVSASLIQRRFRLGYPRAARIVEIFEKEGVVGPANGSKPRQVLVNSYKE